MTVGFQNYGYSVPNYSEQQGQASKYSAQSLQQPQTTSFESSKVTTKAKKINKGAIATTLVATAALATTAYAATKGKKITGQDKLIANIKAGFNEIKDDAVKLIKSKLNRKTKEATTEIIDVKPHLAELVDDAKNGIKDTATSTIEVKPHLSQLMDNAQNGVKSNLKPQVLGLPAGTQNTNVKGIVDSFVDANGNKILITNDGCEILEMSSGFNIKNAGMGINKDYSYKTMTDKMKEAITKAYEQAKNVASGIKTKFTNYLNKN